MLEYVLVVGLIALVVIAVVTVVGRGTKSALCSASLGLDAGGNCANLLGDDASNMENSIGGWTPGGGGTVTQTAAQAFDGTHSLALQATAVGPVSAADPVPQLLVPGRGYIARAYFRAATVAGPVSLQLTWNNTHPPATSAISTDTASGWTSASMAFVVPSDQSNTTVTLGVTVSMSASAEVHYVDHVSLAPSPTANLLDTDSADFTGGLGGWARVIDNWLNGDSTVSRDTSTSYSGNSSLRVVTGATTRYSGAGVTRTHVPATEGIYTLSARVKCPNGTMLSWSLGMVGGLVDYSSQKGFTCDGTWQLVIDTYTVGATTVWLEPYVRDLDPPVSVTINVDAVMLTPGNSTTWQPGYVP